MGASRTGRGERVGLHQLGLRSLGVLPDERKSMLTSRVYQINEPFINSSIDRTVIVLRSQVCVSQRFYNSVQHQVSELFAS